MMTYPAAIKCFMVFCILVYVAAVYGNGATFCLSVACLLCMEI